MALLAGVVCAAPGAAQGAVTARNAFYVELLGSSLIYSVNYDRLLTRNVAGRVGFMALGASDESSSAALLAAPITASYLLGERNSHLELGLGVTVASGAIENVEGFEDQSFSGGMATAILGYRYQRPAGGFLFRAALTPVISTEALLPWIGISFGYAF